MNSKFAPRAAVKALHALKARAELVRGNHEIFKSRQTRWMFDSLTSGCWASKWAVEVSLNFKFATMSVCEGERGPKVNFSFRTWLSTPPPLQELFGICKFVLTVRSRTVRQFAVQTCGNSETFYIDSTPKRLATTPGRHRATEYEAKS